MNFTNSYRMERVYFERLKSMIDILKPYLNEETDEKLKSILENSIDDNGAILLLYRNLGECWAELSDLIKKADEKIDSLDDKTEKYHDELNERIDEVNNYIMAIIREIEARLETVEQDLATMSRAKILDLVNESGVYHLEYKGEEVDFSTVSEWVEFPHDVIVRGSVNGEDTVFQLREFDTDDTSGVLEFYVTGLIDNVVHEITVTMLPDDSVNVATDIQAMKEYTAGNGINISSDDEISVDFDVVQEKLTAGSGISIDPDTKEITNTSPGKIYTAGFGIAIDPDTNEISNTEPGEVYTEGNGIDIVNNAIYSKITNIARYNDLTNKETYEWNLSTVGNTFPYHTSRRVKYSAGQSFSFNKDLIHFNFRLSRGGNLAGLLTNFNDGDKLKIKVIVNVGRAATDYYSIVGEETYIIDKTAEGYVNADSELVLINKWLITGRRFNNSGYVGIDIIMESDDYDLTKLTDNFIRSNMQIGLSFTIRKGNFPS